MNAFCILFAFVTIIVTDQVLGAEVCPDKAWKPEDGPNRCTYWCLVGKEWKTGHIYNGTECWYNREKNGTCYKGLCYSELPGNVTLSSPPDSTDVISTEVPVDNSPDTETELTTNSPTTATHTAKKKEKESKKNENKDKIKEKKKKKKKPKNSKEGVENETNKQEKEKQKKKKKGEKEKGDKKKKKKEEEEDVTPQEW
uniref:Basic tail secreted protein n=1 Tax=Rhipicephalus appendiculatus TaxID=34631 RepID=A0A131YW37_RHIAP